ncbi:MAG: hypothetical protein QG622_1720 [Actinomycetota bacterium]|nr:hypothetical protein [Actinomycetota bacterium]
MGDIIAVNGLLVAYSIVGVTLFVVSYGVLDLLTPGHLTRIIAEGGAGATALAAGQVLGIAAIIAFAMMGQEASWEGLGTAAIVSLVGVLTQAIGSWVIRLLFVRVGDVDLPAEMASGKVTTSSAFLAVTAFGLGVVTAVAVH